VIVAYPNSVALQLYHGENNKMMMRSALY